MYDWVAKEKRGFFCLCVAIIIIEVFLIIFVVGTEHERLLRHERRLANVNNEEIVSMTITGSTSAGMGSIDNMVTDIPKSNVFCADNRKLLTDSTYQENYHAGKFNMAAYAQTQMAADDRRIARGFPVTKFNIFPGLQREVLPNTTYDTTFNKDKNLSALKSTTTPSQSLNGHCHLKPNCTHCMYKAILDSHHFKERPPAKKVSDHDHNEALQGTHFAFGNDKVKHVTSYIDFTASTSSPRERTKMISPPVAAEVMPNNPEPRIPQSERSSLQRDFTYFGRTSSEDNHRQHMQNVKEIHTILGVDSVRAPNQDTRGKLMTRSMLDYIHPLDMKRKDSIPTISSFRPKQVQYQLRSDNVWSLSRRTYDSTENSQNYSWLPSVANQDCKRYHRGQVCNKVR